MHTYERNALAYYSSIDKKCPALARHSRNLNICCLENKLDPCYHRDSIIATMQKLLLRKNKANILLTGAAGCGKTALAEGLATEITLRKLKNMQTFLLLNRAYKKDLRAWESGDQTQPAPVPPQMPTSLLSECVIYELSLNDLVSGTRYRGEFEEKIGDIIRECKRNPEVILFIDEVHHAVRVGSAEGCVSAAQILKPALARNEVRVIGATTTQESQELLADHALARRFSEIEVPELSGADAIDTARRILDHYCAYHNIQTNVSAETLLSQVQFHLPNTVFPDNFINLVDETLAGAVFDGLSQVGLAAFSQTLSRLSGHLIICTETQAS